jgi:hypothetical protein
MQYSPKAVISLGKAAAGLMSDAFASPAAAFAASAGAEAAAAKR